MSDQPPPQPRPWGHSDPKANPNPWWRKPPPYRRTASRPEPKLPFEPEPRPSLKARMHQILHTADDWLELPDHARRVGLKAGKIGLAALTAAGVCRLGYLELKQLREEDKPEPDNGGYLQAQARVLSYARGEAQAGKQDPSAAIVQSAKDLLKPFYTAKKISKNRDDDKAAKPRKPDDHRSPQNPEADNPKRPLDEKKEAKDPEEAEGKPAAGPETSSGAGGQAQGPAAASKKEWW